MLALLDLDLYHETFLSRMQNSQGIGGAALDWLSSYLKDRTQQVNVNNCVSMLRDLVCGFPQGSKIEPQAYKKYTETLGTLARLTMIAHHFYADDIQLWKTDNPKCPNDVAIKRKRLELAISQIATWMRDNKL